MGMVEDIGQWMQDEGHGTQGTDIFIDGLPAAGPAQVFALVDATTRAPILEHDSVIAEMAPNLQIISRADTPKAARDRADVLFLSLAAVQNELLSSRMYYSIKPLSQPHGIGRDQQRRDLVSMNFEVNHAP